MIKLTEHQPHLKAFCVDGSHWLLLLSETESFLTAWMGGKSFWTGLSAYNNTVHIKLSTITGTSIEDEAKCQLVAEERERRKFEEQEN